MPLSNTVIGSFWRSLHRVLLDQSMASCKALGRLELLKRFGRRSRFGAGKLGYSFLRIRTEGSELGQRPRMKEKRCDHAKEEL